MSEPDIYFGSATLSATDALHTFETIAFFVADCDDQLVLTRTPIEFASEAVTGTFTNHHDGLQYTVILYPKEN